MSKMDQDLFKLRSSYDEVAEEYVARIFHELEYKPLDCELLDRFAANARDAGLVCDLGCGPGHVARYLFERGVNAFGLDLSPRMIEQAQRLNPGIVFEQGNMLALDAEDEAWGGIVAFYSIIHIPRNNMIAALQEFKRVLRPQGLLLLAFHVGQETLHREELWGKKVSLDFLFFERDEIEGYLKSVGFEIDAVVERPPYEDVEYPSHRAYIFARKP